MPLHDWSNQTGWDGVHTLWITELLRFVKPRLPAGYRAYIGTSPTLTIGAPPSHADVQIRDWRPEPPTAIAQSPTNGDSLAPDGEEPVAVLTTDPALYVSHSGHLVAAVELISPRNKDRPSAQDIYVSRYLGYLHEGVHLLLVDVHRLPMRFSFADRIMAELRIEHAPMPSPYAIAFRVGETSADGGRFLAHWRRALAVGEPLPTLPLALSIHEAVMIDLESTYSQAAADAYLE